MVKKALTHDELKERANAAIRALHAGSDPTYREALAMIAVVLGSVYRHLSDDERDASIHWLDETARRYADAPGSFVKEQ
jgi:hypothetical protein